MAIRERRSEDLPLGMIDGISQFHETRLRDLGIDNVQNLASIDIPFTLINTTFSAQEIIDWVDQAVLYLHLESAEMTNFRNASVRTVSDFRQAWKNLYDEALVSPTTHKAPTNGASNPAASNSDSQEDKRKK